MGNRVGVWPGNSFEVRDHLIQQLTRFSETFTPKSPLRVGLYMASPEISRGAKKKSEVCVVTR